MLSDNAAFLCVVVDDCAVNGVAWAKLESSMLPQIVELLPSDKVGYLGVFALICSGALVVGWSELRHRSGTLQRHGRSGSSGTGAKSKKQ